MRVRIVTVCALLLTACQNAEAPPVARFVDPSLPLATRSAPPTEQNGGCWDSKGADGVAASGTEVWFEAVCASELTPTRIATLQRALQVRGHFWGEVTGEMDDATRAAIRSYQAPLGLSSGRLSREASERLGVVPVGST